MELQPPHIAAGTPIDEEQRRNRQTPFDFSALGLQAVSSGTAVYGPTTELFEGRAACIPSISEGQLGRSRGSEGKATAGCGEETTMPLPVVPNSRIPTLPLPYSVQVGRCVSRRPPPGPIVPPKGCKTDDQSATIHADALAACPPCVERDPGLRPHHEVAAQPGQIWLGEYAVRKWAACDKGPSGGLDRIWARRRKSAAQRARAQAAAAEGS